MRTSNELSLPIENSGAYKTGILLHSLQVVNKNPWGLRSHRNVWKLWKICSGSIQNEDQNSCSVFQQSSTRFLFDSSGFCELLAFLLWKTAGVATSSSFHWNNGTVRFENVSVQCQMPWVLLFGSSCYDREFRCLQITYSPTLMRWKLLNKRSSGTQGQYLHFLHQKYLVFCHYIYL